jgi:hypothetical protein
MWQVLFIWPGLIIKCDGNVTRFMIVSLLARAPFCRRSSLATERVASLRMDGSLCILGRLSWNPMMHVGILAGNCRD